jgi:hypothetical protein
MAACSTRAAAGMPIIGFLGPTKPATWNEFVTAFVRRLRELGWIEDVGIEYH